MADKIVFILTIIKVFMIKWWFSVMKNIITFKFHILFYYPHNIKLEIIVHLEFTKTKH